MKSRPIVGTSLANHVGADQRHKKHQNGNDCYCDPGEIAFWREPPGGAPFTSVIPAAIIRRRFSAATAADVFNNQFNILNIGGGSHSNLGSAKDNEEKRKNKNSQVNVPMTWLAVTSN